MPTPDNSVEAAEIGKQLALLVARFDINLKVRDVYEMLLPTINSIVDYTNVDRDEVCKAIGKFYTLEHIERGDVNMSVVTPPSPVKE